MLSAVAPSMLEDGTSLSALEPKTFLRMDEGPSGLSFPSLEPNLSSETFSVPQPGTFASQANNGQQQSHRVENQQQLVQFHSDEQMKGQGGNSGYPIYIPKMTPEKDITTHPFYRLPRVVPGAFVRGFREARLDRMAARRFNSLNSMVLVKECLKMPVIDWQHLDILMTQVEFLAGFAIVQMRGDIDKKKPKVAVERLAFALILVDSLYAATEVWGPQSKRDEWWGSVVSAIPVYPGPTKVAASRPTAEQNILLAQSLQSALDTYRSGKRPTAEVLVSLKQKIFCTRQIPRFQRGQWLKWRTDDLEWRGSL
ncbi:uncharacterized protein EMH_0039670 [Eimeria mitis]|uniref:Uncharacterized protein n=1 Tax=Eimeria mitis TaxID=44415 RepID=U6JS76_9EIME|nr:uncharacterized protein EMH_0039670 [Eimeria mitis]CDJ28305.1 hypothetical protein, conserved [Eimeria mitis]